jgi:putative peptide zinc metalloprotease protein
MSMFDGTRSLDEIKKAFEEEFPPQKIKVEDLQRFIGQLHQSNLIVALVPNQGTELLAKRRKRKRQEFFQYATNILSIKFKGFDPDRILNFLYTFVAWCFHRVFVAATLLLCLAAVSLVVVQFDVFYSKLPAFYSFFSATNICLLTATLGATKIIHEFGHGLTAKHFDCECHELGFMLLVLTPCLYVNISDAWLLPNKYHRMAIAAAGVWVECTLASICTFLWWFSEPGILHYLCLNIMFVSSVSTIIFNMNPLLRYDGYYVMSDWLEIPNLRQKATKILTQKCSQWFLGMEHTADPFLPNRNQSLFALYSVAAFCYRWVVMASILFFLYKVFEPYGLKIIGQAIAAMSLVSLFGMPLYKVVKFFWIPGRIYQVKKKRFYTSLAVLAAIVCFVCFCPLPYTVIVPVIMEVRGNASQMVYVPQIQGGGRLVELTDAAWNGQMVREGDVLAKMENLSLDRELLDLIERIQSQKAELLMLERLRNESPDAVYRIQPLEALLTATVAVYEKKRELYSQLTLVAPQDGIVISPPYRQHREPPDGQLPFWYGLPFERYNIGAMLEPGTLFCTIGDPKKLEAVLVVDQSKISFLQPEQKVEILLNEFPDRVIDARMGLYEDREMDSVPPQLSVQGGGDVPTTTEADGHERPSAASYRAMVPVDNDDETIRAGMTGLAKVHVAPQTLAARLWRYVQETFHFKL